MRKTLKLKGPSKTQEQHGPGEAYFISFINILQETIYKATMWSPLLNVWCSSVIDSIDSTVGKKQAFAAEDPALQQWGTNDQERDGTC